MVTKMNVNVGTIGHIDHGKTTLTAALLRVQAAKGLAKVKSYQDIAKGGIVRDKNKTVTILASHVKYETESRMYAHIDCPGHADYIKNMAMPGDGVQLQVNLLQPIALTTGDHFAIREGGKTVGSGVVTKVTA